MDSTKEKNFVSAVVYCHNEAKTIKHFIENLDKILNDNFLKYEIIIVNGSCSDSTIDIVKEYAKTKTGLVISILNLSFPWGPEYGINAGIDLSIGDYVFEFNSSECDYDWNILMDMYHKTMEGYDFVCAVSNRSLSFSDRMFYSIINHYAPLANKVYASSFRLLSRRGINRVRSLTKTVASRSISYAKCGLPMANIPYVADKTNIKPFVGETKKLTSILLYTNLGSILPLRMVKCMLLLLFVSVLYTIGYTIHTGIVSYSLLMVLFLELLFVCLFAILSAVALYLKAVIDFVFKKKDAIFVSVEKLANQ